MADRSGVPAIVPGVHELLIAWDPLTLIARGAPDNEYDCMAAPLVSQLQSGADAETIVAWLRQEFPAHFGLRGPRDESLRAFVAKLLALSPGR